MIQKNEVHVWWARIDSPEWNLSHMYSLLSDGEKNKADRFCFAHLRRGYIVAHGILRSILGKYICARPESLTFINDPLGKPFLKNADGRTDFFFNLSHSQDAVLIGISLNQQIGVDIEYVRPVSGMQAIVERYFSREESNALHKYPFSEQNRIFFKYWTIKESYLKATGKGLSGLRDIRIIYDGSASNFHKVTVADFSQKLWSIYILQQEPEYAAALAVEGKGTVHLVHQQCLSQHLE